MNITALDSKINLGMFIKGLGNKIQGIMAKSISPEEKLRLIQDEMKNDVFNKRLTARNIRAKMVALSDPDTKELEPLEQLRARREKLVAQGKRYVSEGKSLEATKVAQEIKSLDTSLSSMEMTYQTLKEAYDIALENYKVSQEAYDKVVRNGSMLLDAIKAHQDALKIRDNTKRDSSAIDSSFLSELEGELTKAKSELKSDVQLDKEVTSVVVEEDNSSLEGIMNEFK